ncbi:hypothetical protein QJQ45_026123, partial [Haematococcus lacustris]
ASGSGQQDVGDEGQAVKEVIGQRRQVLKAALRGLVKAARPDLSPAQVDAASPLKASRQQVQPQAPIPPLTQPALPMLTPALPHAAHPALQPPNPAAPPVQLGIWDPNLLAQIRDTMGLLTSASVLEHMMRGPHHRSLTACLYAIYAAPFRPKSWQMLHRAAEYRRGIDGRARNNA